jgi:hypothetical protein
MLSGRQPLNFDARHRLQHDGYLDVDSDASAGEVDPENPRSCDHGERADIIQKTER